MAYLMATGFELDSYKMFDADPVQADKFDFSGGAVARSGSYGLSIGAFFDDNQVVYLPLFATASEIYVNIWVNPNNYVGFDYPGFPYLRAYLSDGNVVGMGFRNTTWRAYVNNTQVAAGSATPGAAYHRLQFHVNVADSGAIDSKVNGVDDIAYSGDTKPGASTTITKFEIRMNGQNTAGWRAYFDDLTIKDDAYSDDLSYGAILVPEADTATKSWSCSTGSDNYDLVREIPCDDTDYVYSATNGQQDLYDLVNWSGSGKSVKVVTQWSRAKRNTAGGQQIKLLAKSGATLSTSAAIALTTTFQYKGRCLEVDPSTSAAWTDSGVDGLQIGQEMSI